MYDWDAPEYSGMKLPSEELFYDEFRFVVGADLALRAGLMFIKLNKFEMDAPNRYGVKQYPHRNTMEMSASDYHQFLLQV